MNQFNLASLVWSFADLLSLVVRGICHAPSFVLPVRFVCLILNKHLQREFGGVHGIFIVGFAILGTRSSTS